MQVYDYTINLNNYNIVISGLILRAVLSIYMEDPFLPLPTPEEVLVCNPSTTAEEVTSITYTHIARYEEKDCVFYCSSSLSLPLNHMLLNMRPGKKRYTDKALFV